MASAFFITPIGCLSGRLVSLPSLKPFAPGDIEGAMNHTHPLSAGEAAVSWVLQLIVAGILLQTLFFKFTGAEESVYIFTTLGAEPWGRIGSGVVELVASILLLVPATIPLGAILSIGVISGAILSHLAILGIEIKGDGGLLFWLAVTVFVLSLAILAIRRSQIPIVGRLVWSA